MPTRANIECKMWMGGPGSPLTLHTCHYWSYPQTRPPTLSLGHLHSLSTQQSVSFVKYYLDHLISPLKTHQVLLVLLKIKSEIFALTPKLWYHFSAISLPFPFHRHPSHMSAPRCFPSQGPAYRHVSAWTAWTSSLPPTYPPSAHPSNLSLSIVFSSNITDPLNLNEDCVWDSHQRKYQIVMGSPHAVLEHHGLLCLYVIWVCYVSCVQHLDLSSVWGCFCFPQDSVCSTSCSWSSFSSSTSIRWNP